MRSGEGWVGTIQPCQPEIPVHVDAIENDWYIQPFKYLTGLGTNRAALRVVSCKT